MYFVSTFLCLQDYDDVAVAVYIHYQTIVGQYWFGLFDLRPCQRDNGYLDGRSQIKVHTDERTQVHSAQSSLAVTHPGTNRARRSLTSMTESPSKHWSPLWTSKTSTTHSLL